MFETIRIPFRLFPNHRITGKILIIILLFCTCPLSAEQKEINIIKDIGFDGYEYKVSFIIQNMSIIQLESLLASESFLESIPYYSRYNGTTSKLYENVDFKKESLNVTLHPFKPFTGIITSTRIRERFEWNYANTDPVRFGWITVIKDGNLNTDLVAIQSGDSLKIEGKASLKTFPFLFLFGKRIEWAIEGRILAMFYALAEPDDTGLSTIQSNFNFN